MHTHRVFATFIFVLMTAGTTLADHVVLKNGDRLTGTIEKADETVLVLKTDFAGELNIKAETVQTITSDGPLHVALKSGETITGPVAVTDDTLDGDPVRTSDHGPDERGECDPG